MRTDAHLLIINLAIKAPIKKQNLAKNQVPKNPPPKRPPAHLVNPAKPALANLARAKEAQTKAPPRPKHLIIAMLTVIATQTASAVSLTAK